MTTSKCLLSDDKQKCIVTNPNSQSAAVLERSFSWKKLERKNLERKYVIKPIDLIMANENRAPVFLSRRVRLKANEAARVNFRMKTYNELSENKQVRIVPNPISQSAAVLGRSFSITKSGLCVSVLLNTLDIPITTQR